ncbi:MAG: HlyD family efflux transporter periplasmic adaptor subunit [Anaerolineae bacterium]|nr:HlyD family efflux transporter periplasmic adaptor subunit [Anaerolineae bacterium]
MKRVLSILLILAVVIGATVGSYYYFQPAEPQSLAEDPNIEIVEIGRDTLLDTVSTTGRIEPKAEVEMNFEIGGVVADVLVERGQHVMAGTVLALLTTDDLELAIRRAEIDLTQQEAELEKLFEPKLEEKIKAAQARVQSARLRLAKLLEGPDEDEIIKAAVELKRKEIVLKEAQWAYDQVAYRGDVAAMPQANQLQQATLEHEAAQADYNLKTRGPTEIEIAEARTTLADAEATLAELLQGPGAADIASRQAAVERARITLEESKRDLERAVLVAPTDGVVLDINIEPGERVLSEAQNAAIIIADTSAFLLKAEVDELDISRIGRAQNALVVIDALLDKEFEGRVADISPRPVQDDQNAIVMYEVIIAFDTGNEAANLLPGMTANATIETRRLAEVVVVPNQAIQIDRTTGGATVYVEKLDSEGNAVKTEIELGLQDETVTEVVTGLDEGDQVIIRSEPESLSTPNL